MQSSQLSLAIACASYRRLVVLGRLGVDGLLKFFASAMGGRELGALGIYPMGYD